MKNLLYLLVTSCLLLLFSSCEEFLEEVPKDAISPANFYNDGQDALAAVNGAYAALQDQGYYSRYWVNSSGHASDGIYSRIAPTGDRGVINNFIDAGMLVSSRYNLNTWRATWQAINRANAVMDNVPGIEMDEALKTRILAEAKFLRALTYFNMVRRWGDLPIVLSETNTSDLQELQVTRRPAAEVYEQIFLDLQDAAADLPAISEYGPNDLGRASKEAAQGLLAKAYLYRENWQGARDNALAVINSPSGRDLLPEPAALWQQEASDNTVESIFEVQYNGIPQGHAIGNNYEPRGNGLGPGAWGTMHARLSFFNKFSDGDKRKAATFLTEYAGPNTDTLVQWWENITVLAPHIAKYRDPDNRIADGMAYNIKVLRFADVLLVASEAINELEGPTPEAYAHVNRVRARAGLGPLSGLTKEQLRDSIYLEFRRELCYEGQDFEELVRTGKLVESVTASTTYTIPTLYDDNGNVVPLTPELRQGIERWQPRLEDLEMDPHNVLFPLPQDALDKNPNLKQNTGY